MKIKEKNVYGRYPDEQTTQKFSQQDSESNSLESMKLKLSLYKLKELKKTQNFEGRDKAGLLVKKN